MLFVANPEIVQNAIKDVGRHDPKPCSLTSVKTMSSAVVLHQENEDPGDITAAMLDTSTVNLLLLTDEEFMTPVTPGNFVATAVAHTLKECMQC